jgi:thiol-disulfide isomerase/thioredoxin
VKSTLALLAVALLAGGLGVAVSLRTSAPGRLLHSDLGQRVFGAVLDARAPPPPAGVAIARPNRPLPPLILPDLQGRPVQLPTDYAGRPLLINVWASWCGPCVEEMPELQRFSIEQGPNGTQVVGIALDNPTAVRAFLQRVLVAYPILIDFPGPADAGVRLGNRAGVLPYSVLLTADGVLRKQRIGPFAPGELRRWAQP